MKSLDVIAELHFVGRWLASNQQLLTQYVVNAIAGLVIFLLGRLLARILSRSIAQVLQRKSIDHTIVMFVKLLIYYMFMLVVIIAALGTAGVQTGSILAVLGTAGLAVAFALKDSLSNFAAGILLVIFRPFRIGEFVEISGATGTVESIHFFSTVLKTSDHKMVVVPNGSIVKGNITNYSRQPQRRVELLVSVAYTADIDQVKALLTTLAQADDRVLKSPEVSVLLKELAPSSLDFIMRAWVNNADYWPVYFNLLECVKKQLDVHKIAIPYPQLDVHLHPTADSQ